MSPWKTLRQQDETRKAAGVHDDVLDIEGVTLPMAVEFGKNEVLSVEDVAGLVPDDLRGYTEVKNEAGWIDESALAVEEEDVEDVVVDENAAPTAEDVFG